MPLLPNKREVFGPGPETANPVALGCGSALKRDHYANEPSVVWTNLAFKRLIPTDGDAHLQQGSANKSTRKIRYIAE